MNPNEPASTDDRASSSESSESSAPAGPPLLDAVVIGTGFGGAVTACRLAQAGLRVQVIERGRRYEEKDFPALPVDSALVPDLRRWTWQQSQGLWDILDLEELIAVQAAGYGGGSLIYANVHLRPPATVFDDDRWPAAYRKPETLRPFFDLAGYMLDVAPITAHQPLFANLTKADQLGRAFTHLGRGPGHGFFYPPLAISRQSGPNRFGREQKACVGCGACCTGCPEKAKNTLDFNYLALAERHGARVACQVEVSRIVKLRDGSWEVRCIDHLRARRRTYRAQNVFLCAGSVHSTRLLRSARLRGKRARKSQALAGLGYFPGGDALGVVYDTQNPQHPSFGPAITTSTAACDPDRPGSFFMIQDGGYAAELARLVGTLRAPAWVGRNRLTRPSPASVSPSWIGPAPVPKTTLPLTLASPLDDLLAAMMRGDFKRIASPALRAEWMSFLSELKKPILLAPVVARTIEESIDDWIRRCWLTRRLDPNGGLVGAVKALHRWIIRKTYGSNNAFANRALRAVLNQGNLSPAEIGQQMFGYTADKANHRTMLLAMGRDAASGVLHYDRRRDRMIADLDLFHLVPGYTSAERLMSDVARTLGGELRINPAWSFLGKPITVHNQGGCGMSDPKYGGVTTPFGRVRGTKGLYVSDGSILCTSVGVNPSATIMAIAEKNVLRFIRDFKHQPQWPSGSDEAGAREYQQQTSDAAAWAERATADGVMLQPPVPENLPFNAKPLGVAFDEVMEGYFSPTLTTPPNDASYRVLETAGRIAYPLRLELELRTDNLALFREDLRHRMRVTGTVRTRLPTGDAELSYPARGYVDLLVKRFKPYAISRPAEVHLFDQQVRLAGGYRTRKGEPKVGEQRFMKYRLWFQEPDGRRWKLSGYKRIRDDPGPDAWRDTSSLLVSLLELKTDQENPRRDDPHIRGAGVVHVDLEHFLYTQLPSLRAIGGQRDRTRALWAKVQFATFFFGTLQRIYLPEVRAAIEALFKPHPENLVTEPHRVPR